MILVNRPTNSRCRTPSWRGCVSLCPSPAVAERLTPRSPNKTIYQVCPPQGASRVRIESNRTSAMPRAGHKRVTMVTSTMLGASATIPITRREFLNPHRQIRLASAARWADYRSTSSRTYRVRQPPPRFPTLRLIDMPRRCWKIRRPLRRSYDENRTRRICRPLSALRAMAANCAVRAIPTWCRGRPGCRAIPFKPECAASKLFWAASGRLLHNMLCRQPRWLCAPEIGNAHAARIPFDFVRAVLWNEEVAAPGVKEAAGTLY